MEKKNKIILAVVAVAIVAAIIIAAVCSSKPKSDSGAITNNTTASQATEEPEVTPTFVYFVSQNDADYAAAMATVEKLKTEYEGKVNFDIRDYDADPTIAENFAMVVGNTPALIMLDTHNAPCDFLFKTSDEAALKASIEKALGE